MRAPAVIVLLLLVLSFVVLGFPSSARAATLPGYIVYSVPITLNNQESTATPSPFQQMITVNSAQFGSYEASSLQNVAFFYSNGTIVPSWLESGNSNTATSTIYWLRLADGIPAQSSMTIYMGFAAITTNLMNNQATGEAPDLSNPVGKYDDGNNVFLAYGDFDLGLGSWTAYSAAGSFLPVTTNNGLEMLNGGSGENNFLVPSNSIPEIPITIEYSWEYSNGGDVSEVAAFGSSPVTSGLNSANYGYCEMKDAVCAGYYYYEASSWLSQSIAGSSQIAKGSFTGQGTFHIVSELSVVSSTSATAGYVIGALSLGNFPQTPVPALLSGSVPNPFGNPNLMVESLSGSASSYQYLHWLVARAYPPNGIMPSVTVGSPTTQTSTSAQATVTVTVTSMTTATLTITETSVSTTTLPAITYTTQLPGSTFTITTTKTVTPAATSSATTSSSTSATSSSQGGSNGPPTIPAGVGVALGIVLVVFIAFVLVRVVFWRRIKDIMERL